MTYLIILVLGGGVLTLAVLLGKEKQKTSQLLSQLADIQRGRKQLEKEKARVEKLNDDDINNELIAGGWMRDD